MTDQLTTLLPRLYAALDEHRFADLAEFYTPDVRATTPGGDLVGHAELVAQATRNHAHVAALQHQVTGLIIDREGDRAELRANLVAVFADHDRAPVYELGGVWRGQAELHDGGWRISGFTIVPTWQRGTRPAT
jgi:hypothetical protein